MYYFKILKALRTDTPDIKKAVKALKILAAICVLGAVWNIAFYYLSPISLQEPPFNFPLSYPYIAVSSLTTVGVFFFGSSYGIKEMQLWGKRLAQFSILLLTGMIIAYFYIFTSSMGLFRPDQQLSIIFKVFTVICVGQFIIPAYLGLRYLGRLPVNPSGVTQVQREFEEMERRAVDHDSSSQDDTT